MIAARPAKRGGNLLLNVGPTADGEFPAESVERLAQIGDFMRVAGESIRGTSASPFPSLPWGRCTQRRLDASTTRLSLHVWDRPRDGVLVLPGLLNEVRRARPLATINQPFDLPVERSGDDVTIRLGLQPGPGPVTEEVSFLDVLRVPGRLGRVAPEEARSEVLHRTPGAADEERKLRQVV